MSFDTKILKVNPETVVFKIGEDLPTITDPDTERNLQIAANELKNTSNVVGFPTETVYGLGGSALNDESVKSIYRAKNRPADNPLIVHVSSIDQLKRKLLPKDYIIPSIYSSLLEKMWPGPLTILLPVHEDSILSKLVTAGQDTFAVRLPSHPIARALIALSDTPIAAPSANSSTRPSPTLASHVYHDLNTKIPYILDGGSCNVGLESTVVDGLSHPPMLLRPGGISLEEIRRVGGPEWVNIILAKKVAGKNEAVRTPGMKYRHYSPSAPVILFLNCSDGEVAINNYIKKRDIADCKFALLRTRSFIPAKEISKTIIAERELGTTGGEISRNLFKMLREVDELGVDLIFVEGVDEIDEGLAIMNRLSKAAFETIIKSD
ncbi:tRNA A37 threonylcarbamoyladenosine synthetase subunit [Yamadazyma tenuis]|uniref:Threonylcarbamoyl-AMP synthase n=1 Tax=Candida tenuis (strain ATCC 10573 / BCRC 21748 / CBS 615 / JCM 9827 / NBRC 10315 / NRRL Y-1498 / VKM Y-70) TaxID=590646 RepID=G3B4I8_CANTC|nr:translation factor [Yamadazyma tenuis ATCC 10573]XP_006686572.1 uncharacterized protein CANTEDRAFT_113868 [Yamadazyma tenuis ATCC 10573]EGV64257.1 translation factor [Yamadazyma tenuis ATCC 10573]EGV64258.1 hypothetical protein CANTEDRAFT_113868 [Yamadazyma tenuis ATCC 10573]WEJ96547.1 tRNA A37 threonylcarbamoyladenosine synthetase subunit [Yamadazyma tenuis]